jgi:hypothetical protein
MTADLDALGLLANRRRFSVRFGDVEAGPALRGANMSNAMNQMPNAEITIDLARLGTPVDYLAGLSIAAVEGDRAYPRFLGSVVSAEPKEDRTNEVEIEAVGAAALSEQQMMGMAARGVPSFELVYVVARSAGLREEQLSIEGIEQLPRESFEVVAPIDNVIVNQVAEFAGVHFLPRELGARSLAALEVDDDLSDSYAAPTYALALVTANRCFDAEEHGLAMLDLALAWLTVRLRYGLAVLPAGQPLPFQRSESLANPSRRDIVFVRGLTTTRQWIRRPRTVAAPRSTDLTPADLRLDPRLPRVSLQEQQAILALARAASEVDPLGRVQALFEAIEFYVGDVKADKLFSKSDRKRILRAIPPLREDQSRRIDQLVGDINNAPLRTRLMRTLDIDEVPVAAAEIKLLWRLRELRNDVVHGRRSELPVTEDVEYGVSIVSRMLVHRVARLLAERGQ